MVNEARGPTALPAEAATATARPLAWRTGLAAVPLFCSMFAGWTLLRALAAFFPQLLGPTPLEPAVLVRAGVLGGFVAWLLRGREAQAWVADALRLPLAALTIFVVLPSGGFRKVLAGGLDTSWMAALALAIEHRLVFGRDFVFTYGPLGYFVSRVPPAGLAWTIPVHDLLLFADLLYVIGKVYRRSAPALGALTLGALAVMTPAMYLEEAPSIWFVLIGAHGALCITEGRAWHATAAAVISIFLCFSKLNVGLIAIVPVIGLLAWITWTHRARRSIWLAIPTYLAALVIAGWLLNVDLVGYLHTTMHVVDGYNDAMDATMPFVRPHFLHWELTLVAISAAAMATALRGLWRDPRTIFVGFVVALALFLGFKQGHVRHWGSFIYLAPFPLWLWATYAGRGRFRLAPLAFSLLAAAVLLPARLGPETFSRKSRDLGVYVTHLRQVIEGRVPRDRQGVLAPAVREAIGQRTVDVPMYDATIAYLEGLNYAPRPVIQSVRSV